MVQVKEKRKKKKGKGIMLEVVKDNTTDTSKAWWRVLDQELGVTKQQTDCSLRQNFAVSSYGTEFSLQVFCTHASKQTNKNIYK